MIDRSRLEMIDAERKKLVQKSDVNRKKKRSCDFRQKKGLVVAVVETKESDETSQRLGCGDCTSSR
jgi:hypothetical protein